METNNIDNLRFDINGESYFFHYSSADLKIGDKILPSGSPLLKQAGNTGDALFGRSYAFDALDPTSIDDAIINQTVGIKRDVGTPTEHWVNKIYLTKAPTKNVGADINVLGHSLLEAHNYRAVLGQQEIVDSIEMPIIRSAEKNPEMYATARTTVENLLKKHGIIQNTKEEQALVNIAHTVSNRTVEDVAQYNELRMKTRINDFISREWHKTPMMVRKVENQPELKPFWDAIAAKDLDKAFGLRHLSDIPALTGETLIQPEKVNDAVSIFKEIEESTETVVGKKVTEYGRKEMMEASRVMSKKTLNNIIKAGQVAAEVVGSKYL